MIAGLDDRTIQDERWHLLRLGSNKNWKCSVRRKSLKATESRCDLILLHLAPPISESVETASLLRGKLPHIKVVGFSSVDLENRVSPTTGFNAVIPKQDGLSKLVETLKALMPEPPRE